MAYPEFTLPKVTRQFGLTIDETSDLFADVSDVALRQEFVAQIGMTVPLAVATSTEKARSEFIVAPILLELWQLRNRKIGLLSGVDFSIDESIGLNGACDYIITGNPEQLYVRSPVLVVVEAKNEDLKKGYAQCIAALVAAWKFNEREDTPKSRMYGAVTIGELWRFIELHETKVCIDSRSYHIDRLPKIMGILLKITELDQ
jgi:hypothetical protein